MRGREDHGTTVAEPALIAVADEAADTLAELAPQGLHPVLGKTYAALWDAYDQGAQPLSRVAFEWRGRAISTAP